MEKEKWKDEVLSSVRGIKRAEPNPFLFTRIEERLKSSIPFPRQIILLPGLSLVFTGLALLFILNVVVLKKSYNDSSVRSYSLNSINYEIY